MKLAKVFSFLFVACPWTVDAQLRNKRKHRKRNGNNNNVEAVGFENGYEVEDGAAGDVETVEVIIGLNIPDDEYTFTAMSNTIDLLSDSVSLEKILPQIKSGVARIPLDMIETLKYDPRVMYVELNGDVYENSEFIPPGIAKSFANSSPFDYKAAPGVSFECNNPNAFRVALVDGGIDVGHYDFEFCGVYDANGLVDPNRPTHCMGKAFLRADDAALGQDWYNTARDHGMHVAGTMVASGLNDAGITGMIADEQVCLVVARVFGDGGGATVSNVADAIMWTADVGSKVINMSLGTSTDYSTVKSAIQYAYSKGSILVASAGNGADDDPQVLTNFPADYPEVLSIAAVDAANYRAPFSNYNQQVSMAAIGVDVLSTYPLPAGGTDVDIESTVGTFSGVHMIYSRYTSSDGVTGVIADCDNGQFCSGKGHVCLFERNGVPFHSRVLQCEKSGGVATIIYSDKDDTDVLGTMGVANNSPKFTAIPAVGVRRSVGLQLLGVVGKKVTLSSPLDEGYGTMSGTSMAAPHVSGAAGTLWRSCIDCSRKDVVDCLLTTADDAGAPGKDIFYGEGILNTAEAFTCLTDRACCEDLAAEEIIETQAPSHGPTTSPTPDPTTSPTKVPTVSPSIPPTPSPFDAPSGMPIQRPSTAPVVLSSPLVDPKCDKICNDKELFCVYKAQKDCSIAQGQCASTCQSAIDDGTLDVGMLNECKALWCLEEKEDCVAANRNSCENDNAACKSLCSTTN